ncbi:MAG TPA: hypothetical protein DCE71_02185, partial [Parachlamydiales bacterium]|nr:hypothetical protein [Parachlamydiales bacterium]
PRHSLSPLPPYYFFLKKKILPPFLFSFWGGLGPVPPIAGRLEIFFLDLLKKTEKLYDQSL